MTKISEFKFFEIMLYLDQNIKRIEVSEDDYSIFSHCSDKVMIRSHSFDLKVNYVNKQPESPTNDFLDKKIDDKLPKILLHDVFVVEDEENNGWKEK